MPVVIEVVPGGAASVKSYWVYFEAGAVPPGAASARRAPPVLLARPLTIGRVHLVALVPLVAGLVVAAVGVLGLLERLPRNRFGGVRTPATLRDDTTFRIGNKVAGLPIAVGGAVGVAGGAAGLAMTGAASVVVAVLALLGTIVIAAAGGVLGHRAAEAVPAPEPELPAGCKGCQCGGCDIAASRSGSVGANVAGVGGE
jgi:hypothetical protein